ncbi:hypothetical protein [Amycolatopsis solani]|uniref:hypothetical protein n=1 Tax=Amycolatopsis solani TaxID=3028615 RepID=UPI0025B0CFF9|nr:hypothetical protein [Amycolatopsis sp. MEP2-6]
MTPAVARPMPAGLAWRPDGQVVLSGPLLRLAQACDEAWTVLAGRWPAEPEDHPAMLDAEALQAVDFLTSFPHLATFACGLDPAEENLGEFTTRPLDETGVRLTRLAPVREVLTPAACYHVYVHHRGEALSGPRYVTTRNTCFRRETHYEPLRRQWAFRMREIVCLGDRREVTGFLRAATDLVTALFRELALPVGWAAATDPFFRPTRSPKYLAQRLSPTKHEAAYRDLAIASVNLHEDTFGDAYEITRHGRPATTGCVAFGLERWLYALTDRYGPAPAGWPDVVAAARRVTAVAVAS